MRSDLHFLAEASAGGRHLLGSPVLRATVVATVICMLAIGISESVFFAVVDQGLGKPVTFVGVLRRDRASARSWPGSPSRH